MKFLALVTASLASVLTVVFLSSCYICIRFLLGGANTTIYWNQVAFYGFWTAVFTSIIVFVIGVPIYLFLHSKYKATRLNLSIVGFSIPIAINMVVSFLFGPSSGFSARGNYFGTFRTMVVNGERTFWGLLSLAEQTLIFGLYGLTAAIVFEFSVTRLNPKLKQV